MMATLPDLVDHIHAALDRAELSGTVPLQRLERLCKFLSSRKGEVSARLRFHREKGQRTVITGDARVEVELICQSCLASFSLNLESRMRLTVVADENELLALKLSEDGVLSTGPEIELVDILEDGLIVNLPMVPRHPGHECGDRPNYPREGETENRPFSGLSDLMKN